MKTLTTKLAASFVSKELGSRSRQLELMIVENNSASVQVEATCDEVEDFERFSKKQIDSDVIDDEVMKNFVQWLEDEKLLEEGQSEAKA